ncbi:hypothetical protein PX554_21355 [Sphingomonas sp. H39-1-10]|uniref:hypothetical protein n=1 Tax=Sphingomonas pollutisoli TaxID=3030829 RepID=UPI0023B8D22D|nr:hypothetical protein [Sphingomonas pollutisoli]MDF0490684.1 hypothetical protein [Sphingomonas pollutisoli]
MRLLFLAAALLSAPAHAQSAASVQAPGGYAPIQAPCVRQSDSSCMAVSPTAPLPTTQGPLGAAISTPLAGSVTASAVTPTSGAARFADGTATIGPMVPQLGREIGLKLWSADDAIFSCEMRDSIDGGTTKLPLTIFDVAIGGPYTAPVNSAITAETIAGTQVYLLCGVRAGTLNYVVAQ